MSILDSLVENKGDVRAILNIQNQGGHADLSDPEWSSRSIVLSDLEFERIKLSDVEVKANIIRSSFSECVFTRLRSVGHFWGAHNRWTTCTYMECRFAESICPQNYFDGCSFTDLHLIGSTAYETVFRECTFVNAHFEGLSIDRSRSKRKPYPELVSFGVCVVFYKCTFERPRFDKCRFADTAFVDCEVVEPVIENSDFSGVKGSPIWWSYAIGGDPFVAFLDDILGMIEKRLSRESRAYHRMQDYRLRYSSGVTKSRDYSSCLYEGDVPDSELVKIEDWLEGIERQYGW